MRFSKVVLMFMVTVAVAGTTVAADLTEPQKTELRQKFGDARMWDLPKMKDATLRVYLPASSAFFVKSNDAEHADYPYVWLNNGKPRLSRSVDGFLNAGEKVKVGVAAINKDNVRLWIGRQTTNEKIDVRLFLILPFTTHEQLMSQINGVLTIN